MDLFIVGSALIIIAQSSKLIGVLCQKNKTAFEGFNEDPDGFVLDICAGIGGACYLMGTVVYQQL
jgi:hypothetical protein